jgi:hypothetical protein
MRLVLALATAITLVAALATAEAAPPSAAVAALGTTLAASSDITPVCSGCGCRGGPGYRKANGKCASWGRRR